MTFHHLDIDLDPFNPAARHRADSWRYEAAGIRAEDSADDMQAAGNMTGAHAAWRRAAAHYMLAAEQRSLAAGVPGGEKKDADIAAALVDQAKYCREQSRLTQEKAEGMGR